MNIQNLIATGKIEEALSAMAPHYDVVLQSAQYYSGRKNYNMGLLDDREWQRVQAKVNYALLEILGKTNVYIDQKVTINLFNCNLNDFESNIKQLEFDELYSLVMKSFKDEPVLLSQVYDILEPVNKRLTTGQMLVPGSVGQVKRDLIKMYSEYLDAKTSGKQIEQRGDLEAILEILNDSATEEDVLNCFDVLELFLVSNIGFNGLDDLRHRRAKLTEGASEKVLRKAKRLGDRIKEERTWIVQVCNRIIKSLEK